MSEATTARAGWVERPYGRFLLVSAAVRMWRATVPAVIAILANAAVQAVLTYWDVPVGASPAFIASVLLSLAAVLVGYAVLTAGALSAATGQVAVSAVLVRSRATFARFVLWALLQLVVALLAAMLLWPIVPLAVALVAFLGLAAMDGAPNPLVANFATMAARWGRWLATTVILVLGGYLWLVLSSLNTFFIKGTLAALVAWLVGGVLGWWLLTAWALLYRGGPAGGRPGPARD